MALIECQECGREISDRAAACIHCGAPIGAVAEPAPDKVTVKGEDFGGTRQLLVRLATKAALSLNYKIDQADEVSGLVSFTTGMTWGSWSGVSGSIYFEEVEPNVFKASGRGKQNLRGGQVVALDLFGEAGKKVSKVVDEMRRIAQ
ncbi:zinc ribbon domain-containing protein [Tistrella sp. BH-R2-4]|uniref:Zinc ribbon domain-containing protein n=1 Tax=Tistrella arctica TaxID=3133430 RepID=A0ABU9YQZ6_9PROT